MSWKIEKIFTDAGSELSTGALGTTLGSAIQSVYDGRFMWVTCTNGIAIYEFWGQSSGDEPTVDEVDDLLWARYLEEGPLRKLKLITFISISQVIGAQIKKSTRYMQLSSTPEYTGGAGVVSLPDGGVQRFNRQMTYTQKREDLLIATEQYGTIFTDGKAFSPCYIAKMGDFMYVTNSANFNNIWVFNINTQDFDGYFAIGNEEVGAGLVRYGNSNLVASNGKLWFVNTYFDDVTPQKLIGIGPYGASYSELNINVRPAVMRTWIADGFNGFLYLTNHNGVSVTKVDPVAITQTRIRTNALPTRIWSDQNRSIMVNSYGGMMTLIDWDDDGVHNDYACEYDANSTLAAFAFDPTDITKIWYANLTGKVKRYNLVDKTQFETGSGEDWGILETGFGTPDWMTTIPSRTYTTSTGVARTVRPYMFICDGPRVCLFALDNFLIRDNYFEVNGQGAVTGGTLEYFGETS